MQRQPAACAPTSAAGCCPNSSLRAAARRLNAGVDELFVRDGTIHRTASNESATYWELSGEVDLAAARSAIDAVMPALDCYAVRLPKNGTTRPKATAGVE